MKEGCRVAVVVVVGCWGVAEAGWSAHVSVR